MQTPEAMSEACLRTRQYVSLKLDDQLSELEAMIMTSHLARCPACLSFADELERTTAALREADLVAPEYRFELPHRPARFGINRVGTTVAAALLVVAALGGAAGLGSGPSSSLSDWQGAERPSFQEHLTLLALSRPDTHPATPQGIEAAEQTTIGRSQRRTRRRTSPHGNGDAG